MSRRALALWAPLLAALGGVFWLSSLSHVPGAELVWDKLLHATGYAGVSALALRAFHGGTGRLRVGPTAAAAIFMLLWSVSDEIHQSFVPGRDASAGDVVADMVGFGAAACALGLWGARARPADASPDATGAV